MAWDEDDPFAEDEEEDDETEFEEGLTFTGMCFDGKENDDRWSAIRGVCKALGLRPVRADTPVGSTGITEDAKEYIDRAQIVIFEVSGGRLSVYHEIGYAESDHPLEDTLIYAVKGTELAFNVRHRRVHFYETTEDLRRLLRKHLRERIEAHQAEQEDDDEEDHEDEE